MDITNGILYADIKISVEEMKKLCKPGHGEDTCSWLVCGAGGFECLYYHKPQSLIDRRKAKTMVAMRDGCTEVKGINLDELGVGTHVLLIQSDG